MRIVLDACVPRPLAARFSHYDVKTTRRLKLSRLDDGPLLDALSDCCDVFITVDANMPWQQRFDQRPFAVLVLRAWSNRLEDLEPLVPAVLQVLDQLQPGEVREIGDLEPRET
jgi:predicted nuclease of predicted toxin-antitoxin system